MHPRRKEPITHDQARLSLLRFVNTHFNNPGEKSRASIPASQWDDDILLGDYIEQQAAQAASQASRILPPGVRFEAQPDPERVAQLIAHRACIGLEHDPANGKLHGYCVVCGVPWPCEYAAPKPAPPASAQDQREQFETWLREREP